MTSLHTSERKRTQSEEHFCRHARPYLPICNQILWLLAFWLWGNFYGLICPATWVPDAKYFIAALHWYFSIYRLICSTGTCFFIFLFFKFSSIIIHKYDTLWIPLQLPPYFFFILCSKASCVRASIVTVSKSSAPCSQALALVTPPEQLLQNLSITSAFVKSLISSQLHLSQPSSSICFSRSLSPFFFSTLDSCGFQDAMFILHPRTLFLSPLCWDSH